MARGSKRRDAAKDRGVQAAAGGPTAHSDAATDSPIPVVGVGASAGGLDAFSDLLEALPATPAFAVVLVQHLQPTHTSDLAEILARKTRMPVVQVEDGMLVERGHVYVIPPNTEMRMNGDAFALSPRPSETKPSLTVDIFLESLGKSLGNRAIGVVLSGSASDGTKGLSSIKDHDGLTFVQDPDTAAHRGMPDSAIAAGVADAVLPVKEIAQELVRLSEHPHVRRAGPPEVDAPVTLDAENEVGFKGILTRVKQTTGLDLTHYKRSTLLRRIERRMAAKRVADMAGYSALLDSEPEELTELFNDVLVRVTSFFRDPEVFESLKAEVFPAIMERRSDESPVRIWVPGCATGQEAYSIAIALLEYLDTAGVHASVQIFASDLREGDLAIARRGVYPQDIATELSEQRLARNFVPVEQGYQISKTIREMCVFARHDVTRDPPFARLDLVSCRNLLIYLDTTLQRRLLGIFHYALVPEGMLVLGDSEGIGSAPGLFSRHTHKGVFVRMEGETPHFAFDNFARGATRAQAEARISGESAEERQREWDDAQRQLDAMLLDKYAPAAVLVDDKGTVRQIRGDAGEYLKFRPGDATLDFHNMMSVGLASEVDSAIEQVRETGQLARREAVRPRGGGGHVGVGIVVVPIISSDRPVSYAVLFNEGTVVSRIEGESGSESTEVEYLRREVEAAGERLRIMRDGRDAAYESLRAASEEIQSSNEELQSMNEELDTAKEELQSTNEELTTLNDELQARNTALAESNDDLNNLLVSASIAMLVLDADLTIRRFTAEAAHAFNLIPGDIGRRLTDIRWRLAAEDVGDIVDAVVRSRRPMEQEVSDESGRWFRMTVRPYLTGDGGVRGAIVTLVDIDSLRQAQLVLERSSALSEGANRVNAALAAGSETPVSMREALSVIRDILDARRTQLLAWEGDTWTLIAEDPSVGTSHVPRALSASEVDRPDLRVVTGHASVQDISVGGTMRLTIPLFSSQDTFLGTLLLERDHAGVGLDAAEQDFATRTAAAIALYLERERHAQILEGLVDERTAAREEAIRRLETASSVKNTFLANMSHELRTPLNSIIGFTTILLDGMAGDLNEEQKNQLGMVLNSGKHLLAIITDLLDLEKIMAGAMPPVPLEFNMADAIRTVGELERPVAESKGLELLTPGAESDILLVSDELKVRQILLNLVNNAVKFTDTGSVTVSATSTKEHCIVVVEDTGSGMRPEQLEQAFEEFKQVDDDETRLVGGTGLGLSIASRLARLLGGELSAESSRGVGSKFTLTLPLHFEPPL